MGLSHYTLYLQDYGGPVGFRMALAHPERVQALIVQDAVAHNEGLGANWATTNVATYPKWQAWLQKTQPKLLVLRGKHDHSFDPGEPECYRKDVPNAQSRYSKQDTSHLMPKPTRLRRWYINS